jgi:hypothetical protein
VCDARGRIAPSAIDEPLVTDRFIALDEAPEKPLQLRMCIENWNEVLGFPDHHFAAHDRLNSIFGDALAG